MARPRKISEETEQEIVRLRRNGHTCEDTAQRMGVTLSVVYYTMRRYGLNGKIHAGRKNRPGQGRPPRSASLAEKIRRHEEVTIEVGLNGGFIATINGTATGHESKTPLGAINSAEEVD